MQVKKEIEGEDLRLKISGEMTFESYTEFNNLKQVIVENNIVNIDIDFTDLEFIDSSCLGMLFMMKEEIETRDGHIVITGVNGQPKKTIIVCNIDKIFNIAFLEE